VKNESWIWFIPDDDVIACNAVDEFYTALQSNEDEPVYVYTYDVHIIDRNYCARRCVNEKAGKHNNYDYDIKQLKGKTTGSSLGDNIYKRTVFQSRGGLLVSQKRGAVTMQHS
jgi:hypothetical protein